MRNPNPQQQKAIEHHGGVLLSAGAGAGKTFVLVEHIIYLLKSLKQKLTCPPENFEMEIRKYCSGIVMMTFTKKAAGELESRLNRRLIEEIETDQDKTYWKIAKNAIKSMYVGTIHGFCYKLLKDGTIPGGGSESTIISQAESQDKIQRIFDAWLVEKNELQDIDATLYHEILGHYQEFLNALLAVFESPQMRNFWATYSIEKICLVDYHAHFTDVLYALGLNDIFESPIEMALYSDFKKNAWFDLLNSFQSIAGDNPTFSSDKIIKLGRYIMQSRMSGPRKNSGLELIMNRFEKLKKLKEFYKSNLDSYEMFIESKDTIFRRWIETLKQAFEFISVNYFNGPGLTFSDLEYLTYKGLSSQLALENIQSSYKYFIVDEFQDTSTIQYEILRKCIGDNFEKIFCVGDVKQAIYGFRGGELAVFHDCKNKVKAAMDLSNNYRSHEKIINFNNLLFNEIFKLGKNFEGVDPHSVAVDFQKYPGGDNDNAGSLKYINIDIATEEKAKIKSEVLNRVEAEHLLNSLLEIINNEGDGEFCILYKKLAAAKIMLPLLLQNEISFSAQIKVPFSEDPICGIFNVALEAYLGRKEEDKIPIGCFLISKYLELLKSDGSVNIRLFLKRFISDIKLLGIASAADKFFLDLGVRNSNYKNNISLIMDYISIARGVPEKIWSILQAHSGEEYSTEYHYSGKRGHVRLMTSHASKGLEFDWIFLAGIHTNGKSKTDRPVIGEYPGSIAYRIKGAKGLCQSPAMILEKIITTQKNFSESKRLLYVACTRAKKGIVWADISQNGEAKSSGKDSWINALRAWFDLQNENNKKLMTEIQENALKSEVQISEMVDMVHSRQVPFFHRDNLGIHIENETSNQLTLGYSGIVCELSVTRLTTLVECPRKFYFKNICRLDSEDAERLGLQSEEGIIPNKSYNSNIPASKISQEDEVEYDDILSFETPMLRGSFLHQMISQMVQHNFVIPLEIKGHKESEILGWVRDHLNNFIEKYEFVSEVPVKFPIFGHYISGTPDLALIPKQGDDDIIIVDFKTGRIDSSKLDAYWFQLLCYGWYFLCADEDASRRVKLSLMFLDQRKELVRDLDKSELQSQLFEVWGKLYSLDQYDKKQCDNCQFGNICLSRNA